MSTIARAHTRGLLACLRSLVLLPALAWGAWGCQDERAGSQPSDAAPPSTDSGPSGTAARCPSSTAAIDPTLLIDDFEAPTSLLPSIAGRVGGWYSVGDGTPAAILKPRGEVGPETIDGGRCGSLHALHLTGAGFLDWGAQLITSLYYGRNDAGVSGLLPYDGSQYHGVSFYARVGDTSSASIRFSIGDEYSRPEAGRCVVGGGINLDCYDSFGVDLSRSIGTDWREFRVPFSGLAPQNIGLHGDALDTKMMYDLAFNFAANVVFDFWLDDISFY